MSDEDRAKWDERYRATECVRDDPSPFLVSLSDRLPRSGRALDLAGGLGRNARWLAAHGLDTTLADVSPLGLEIATRAAAGAKLSIRPLAVDLESAPLPTDPACPYRGPWDVIVCVLYLNRDLLESIHAALAVDGVFVLIHPTTRNLERHERPPRRFLLQPGEARQLLRRLVIDIDDESWSDDGFHEARILARPRQA